VLAACLVLTAGTLGGLPLLERAIPALPRFRELAILAALGAFGLVVYGATLLGALRLFGVRLRRV
jgi:putative peptidoglycan lipid II flippase